METHCKFKVGDEIDVTFTRFPNNRDQYRVLSTTIKGDSHGTIKLEYIKSWRPNSKPVIYLPGDASIIVEDLWFNTQLTGRNVILLKNAASDE